MALIKCPECGNDVSTEASACPKCGHPVKKNNAPVKTIPVYYTGIEGTKKQRNNGGCLKVILIFLVVIVGIYLIGSLGGSSKSEEFSNTESAAKVWAEYIVKQNLKSPSTAKFCSRLMEMKAESLGGAKWKVTGWVDAQNSFGATVRTYFVVKLELIKDVVRCIDIQLN